MGEGRFDLNNRYDRSIWKGGVNIIAEYDTNTLSRGKVVFYNKAPMTVHTKENSAQYNHRRSMNVPLQLFCRSSQDTLTECSKSIVSQKDGLLITNLDTSSMIEMTPSFVNNVKFASKFLNLQYSINGPSVVNHDDVVEYRIEVRQEMKDVICQTYNNELIVYNSAGYVPVRLVNIVNGLGTFRFIPLGLKSGDTVDLKVGTKSYTNYDQICVTIK